MQGAGIRSRQPGFIEAPAQPAFGGFQQAFFSHFLDGGMQRQIQFMGRYIPRYQLEHDIATVLAALTHQHPIIAILPVQCQPDGNPEVGQLHGKSLAVADIHPFAPLQGLGEVQGHANAVIAKAFGCRFDV
ncbi:hypothetical protein D9M73_225000 [compost metagenome]